MKQPQPTSLSPTIFDHHHHHLPSLPTIRCVYLYATDCRVVPELDVVLLKQTIMARRAFLSSIQK